jgi:hypothetical protein
MKLNSVFSHSPSQSLNKKSLTQIDVDVILSGEDLITMFRVESEEPIYANPVLSKDSSQWGLWDWDVVELFLSVGPDAPIPYYEFQISPLNQYFELEIFEPRKKINRDFHSGFSHGARQVSDREWRAEMVIPLKKLGWSGQNAHLRGNLFAILGEPSKRSYWSAFLPQQSAPDFHLPQFFKPLLD